MQSCTRKWLLMDLNWLYGHISSGELAPTFALSLKCGIQIVLLWNKELLSFTWSDLSKHTRGWLVFLNASSQLCFRFFLNLTLTRLLTNLRVKRRSDADSSIPSPLWIRQIHFKSHHKVTRLKGTTDNLFPFHVNIHTCFLFTSLLFLLFNCGPEDETCRLWWWYTTQIKTHRG